MGKGLSALIPEVDVQGGERTDVIRVSSLKPNPHQPRRSFDEAQLEELAGSLKAHGVIQPLVVRRADEGYEIVAGERRWRAAQRAGLETLPVVVRDISDQRLLTIALVENLQREDLNPLEEAAAFQRLMDEGGLRQEALAETVGRSRPYVANALRLLQLGKEASRFLREGKLTAGHARALVPVPEPLQGKLAQRVAQEGLTVRQTEALVAASGKRPAKRIEETAAYPDWEDRLRTRLGAKVSIHEQGGRGRLVVSYSSTEQLEGILEAILGPIDEP